MFRRLVSHVKDWLAADVEPGGLRIEASPAAFAFVQEGGGRLFVWADDSGLLHTKLHAPETPVDFERHWGDGFELNVDTAIAAGPAPTWYVIFHRFPKRYVEATPYKGGAPFDGGGGG